MGRKPTEKGFKEIRESLMKTFSQLENKYGTKALDSAYRGRKVIGKKLLKKQKKLQRARDRIEKRLATLAK